MKHFIKRGTGVLLALALILSLLPAPALAEELSSSIPAAEAASGEVVQPEFVPAEEGTEAGESSDPAPEAEEGTSDPSPEDTAETGETAPEPEEFPEPAAPEQAAAPEATDDGFQYTVANGAATITGYTGSAASLVIPDTLGGAPVTTIGENAFKGKTALGSVTLPDSVTSIGSFAFMECKGLTSITLPEGLREVGYSAFLRCEALRSVAVPASVTSLGQDSFRQCSRLSSLTLPEGLTEIGSCAFRGCNALTSVRIPASVTSWSINVFQECSGLTSVTLSEGLADVGSGAFMSCPNLRSVLFEGRTTNFNDIAFKDSPQVTLYCPYLSIATTRAIDLQIPFRSTDAGAQDSSLYALDYGKSGLFADINGMSANGCITVTVTYALRAQSAAVPSRLRVVLPANVQLDDESVLLDGAPLTNVTQDSWNKRLWYFPVTESSGTLRLRVRAAEQGSLLGYAQLEMRQGNQTRQEVVGILNEPAQLLTLTMPELTGTAEFALSGIAPPAFPVTLSVDGVEFQKVTASLAGSWSAKLILPNPSDNTIYTVTASCPNGTETLTQSRTLIYEESAPSLTGLELTYNQHGQMLHTDLMGGGTVKPKVYFQPRTEFRFDITFQNPGQVGRAYVTSTRNGEKKYLEARYDSASGKFVAQGFFDPNNPDYVPGKISVEYTPRRPEVNFTQEDLKAMVPNTGLREDQVSVTHPTEGGVTTTKAHFDLTGLAGELKDWAFDTTISLIDGTAGTGLEDIRDTLEKTGKAVSILRGEEKLDLVVAVTSLDEYEGYERWAVLVHNVTDNEYVEMAIDGIQGHTAEGTLVNRGASWLSDNLSTIGKITGMMDAQYKLDKEVEELEQEILSNTSLNAQQRKEALSKLRDYANDKGGFQIACVALPVLAATAGATGGGAALLVFSGILGAMNAVSSFFWDYRVGLIKGESLPVNWVVDPSGYVYDLETGERLEGVTTTAYWISVENDEDLAGDKKPAAGEYGTEWNALEYDQANPLTTDPDGRYQWDVPQGWWRVKYEKAGYVTAWSDWLPVPPPQTEVNVGMAPVNASDYVARLTGQSGSSAAIQVTRQAAGTGSLLFVAAAYDSSGRMTACRTAQWELAAGGSASLSVPLAGQDATLRGFFLSPDSRAPLNRSWRVYLGQ